ncbi:peptide-N4-(N-acetyl-beta- glucosaminyl)asparagine amidase [Didymella heteroderae]|uniref:Peptide-N4-(N-acetyl-beta-glucosaminyl)asparagine amidase n=1 Tax=Didymella heteroderae TaxID=1769908 RepID=A0A9P4WNH4_9PLEO|nr:peptide-N4-(N-acetyl-beta- glucosaminyl)asparagine amidase [Didymella heteroderae]
MLNTLSTLQLRWEHPGLLEEALRVVPLEQIYTEADEESPILQAEADSVGKKAAWGYQDCVIRALLRWFKRSFVAWVNYPTCNLCQSPTTLLGKGQVTQEEQDRGAREVVEMKRDEVDSEWRGGTAPLQQLHLYRMQTLTLFDVVGR